MPMRSRSKRSILLKNSALSRKVVSPAEYSWVGSRTWQLLVRRLQESFRLIGCLIVIARDRKAHSFLICVRRVGAAALQVGDLPAFELDARLDPVARWQ